MGVQLSMVVDGLELRILVHRVLKVLKVLKVI
jgi:hypothetical protein